ncbi:MAG: hypothetical protein V4857_27000 [Pseudomonadota bacterium]
MSAVLLLKLFLVPLLILGVTMAGRRWGPAVAGWLSAFPIVAGPILLTLSLEQGAPFAAHAAHGTLLAVLAILAFTLGYAWASARFHVAGSMACALGAYGVALAALQALHLDLLACLVLVIAALLLAPLLFPAPIAAAAPAKAGPSDVPWRMLAAAVLVLFVTYSASRLGARLSGFLAMFPVMGTVLVGFSHQRSGRAFAVALLRGTIYGYFAFATFCVLVSLLLQRQHTIAFAFSVALACALIVQLLVKVVLGLRQRNAAGAAPALGK